MIAEELQIRRCGDCGVKPRSLHLEGCDVARCLECGWQAISCWCKEPPTSAWSERTDIWKGIWPGVLECIEYGLYCYFDAGWVSCNVYHPKALADINRLVEIGRWDRNLQRYVVDYR